MKLRELQALLQDIKAFTRPKVDLEQYPTGPHLAAQMLFTIGNNYDELEGKTVLDLGCGTGMLSVGAALLGASHVLSLDLDPEALEVARENCEDFDGPLPIDFALCDIPALLGRARDDASSSSTPVSSSQPEPTPLLRHLHADVVIMNPPFGTKRKGVDSEFLRVAFAASRGSIYSLHKTSTRQHIQRLAEKELGAARCEVLAEMRYDLPATMKFHKQKSVDVEVDLWRFEVRPRR